MPTILLEIIQHLEGIEKTLKSINTFDDAFEKVLDKVNIADLISQCMGTDYVWAFKLAGRCRKHRR